MGWELVCRLHRSGIAVEFLLFTRLPGIFWGERGEEGLLLFCCLDEGFPKDLDVGVGHG